MIPSTVTRYLDFGLSILLSVLQNMPEAAIEWPRENQFQDYSDIIVDRHDLLVGAFGSMDGLKLSVQVSEDPDIENATYTGWVHGHFESCVFVFSPRGIDFYLGITTITILTTSY